MTFDSDFDAIAGVTNVDPTTQAATYLINDNGGGNLEPLLDLTVSEAGTLALFVAGFNGQGGCYQYKVEITAPTDAPTPTSGESLTGTVTEEGAGTPISGATITILDGANAGGMTSTSANGTYRFDGLSSGNANLSAEASGYLERRSGTFIDGVTTLNFTLPRATAETESGIGVVINEFRARGPNGESDEFIELRNDSASSVNIGRWQIHGSNSSGTTSNRRNISSGVVLGPGCHYLLGNSRSSGYDGPTDATFGTGITDTGGFALKKQDGTINHQVGMSSCSAFKEWTPLSSFGSSSSNRSYARTGVDTNNNRADFSMISPSTPLTSSASCSQRIAAP